MSLCSPPRCRPRRPGAANLPWPRWLALAWLLLAMLVPAARAQPAAGAALRVHADAVTVWKQAEVVQAAAGSAPDWRQATGVALPDAWAVTRPNVGGVLHYRVTFDLADGAPPRLPALYIERACSALRVELNGRLVHESRRFAEVIARDCEEPVLVVLPAALLQPAGNALVLSVRGHALSHVSSRQRAGMLSALQFGPQSELAERASRQQLLAVRLPEVMSGTLLLMGGFMAVMGWFNRRQSYLAYFGALMVGWAVLLARQWVRELPVPHALAEVALASLMAFNTLAAVQFLLRYAGHRRRWVNRVLPVQVLLMPLSLAAAGPAWLYAMSAVWFALLAAEVSVAAVFHLSELRRQRRADAWPMAVLLATVALSLTAEYVAQAVGLGSRLTTAAQLLPALLFIGLGLRLVQQYGRAYQSAEQQRAELEVRIREATAQIERNFAQLAELKVEQVTERERKRIAGDLHDDLGAKLLTIVHTSDNERISTLAREALEEMRLSVRGLTGKPVKLADALADWRAEVMSRLGQSGVQGEWSAPADEDTPQTLSSRAYVQTTRILREAVSNVIKHSGASQCSVRAAIADGDFQLVIQDNGRGIPMELDGRLDKGHGMASMKGRAKQLAGQCLVESGPGYGTVIRLTLPLERHVTST